MGTPNNESNDVVEYISKAVIRTTIDPRYRCNFCKDVLIDPVQFNPCGHVYCTTCSMHPTILSKQEKSVKYTCCVPDCNVSVESVFQDNALKLSLNNLPAHCPINADCAWSGSVADVLEHTTTCQYAPTICVFSSQGCEEMPRKKDLTKHLQEECVFRMCACPHCGISLTVHDQQRHVENDCAEVEIKCENEVCGRLLPRRRLKRHSHPVYGDCCAQEYPCAISGDGVHCSQTALMTTNKRDEHDNEFVTTHLRMLAERLAIVETRALDAMAARMAERDAEIGRLVTVLDEAMEKLKSHDEALADIMKKMEQDRRVTRELLKHSRSTNTAGPNQPGSGRLDSRIDSLESLIYVSNGQQQELVSALNKTTDERLKAIDDRLSQQIEKYRARNVPIAAPPRETMGATARVNDTVSLLPVASHGILVRDFPEKVKKAGGGIDISLYSSVFHSSCHGYKLCVKLYPNGDGDGLNTHVSVFLVVMKGEFDAVLKWPFAHKVTFMLLDQGGDNHIVKSFIPPLSDSFLRPPEDTNVAHGLPKFCPFEQLTTSAYIRDDCIFIKTVIVDDTNDVDMKPRK